MKARKSQKQVKETVTGILVDEIYSNNLYFIHRDNSMIYSLQKDKMVLLHIMIFCTY